MTVKKVAAKKPASTKKPVASIKRAASSTKAAPPTKAADLVVNQTEMAEVLGITTRWLRLLVADEIITPDARGKFHIGSTVQAHNTYLKEGATKKTGTESLDRLREEKALDIRLNRERKDRLLISMDEALGVVDEITGMFVASMSGLPAQITGVPRERQRLNDICDKERLRLADRFAERRAALRSGSSAVDPAAEDDAA